MNDLTHQKPKDQQFGVVALLGAPNAGKSTLVNVLAGQKVSIVSRKPQTTVFRLTAIVQAGAAQIALIDTPGIFYRDGGAAAGQKNTLLRAAWQALDEADMVLLLIAADSGLTVNVMAIVARLAKTKKSFLTVLNKIDKVKKNDLLAMIAQLQAQPGVGDIMMASALKKDGTDAILSWLVANLPHGPWHYDPEVASDLPDRLFAAEILREELFDHLHQELPYQLGVETEEWRLEKNPHTKKTTLHIHQTIHIEKENHRPIILGQGGRKLKTIATRARQQMEQLFEQKIFLKIFVRFTPDWRQKNQAQRPGLGL